MASRVEGIWKFHMNVSFLSNGVKAFAQNWLGFTVNAVSG